MGYSDFSNFGYIAFGDVPTPPGPPLRVLSTETSIQVKWTMPAISDLDISGYQLNMDDGKTTDLLPVYIGRNKP